ncbi:hypothetical protein [Streptomyces sp. enrichment culture]|uniref:hypothetical protein n=1 Tax=Streptomyces sp. enrichment culture TaxID=1795815 RepID=UPI003F554E7F
MVTADDIARQVGAALREEYRERLRRLLLQQPKEWLADELIDRLDRPAAPALGRDGARPGHRAPEAPVPGGAPDTSRAPGPPGGSPGAGPLGESEEDRARRRERLRACPLDRDALAERTARFASWTRERLEAEGLLHDPPARGGPPIGPENRSPAGEALLLEAKDLLYALLFGDADDGVRLDRVERELLTLTLPRAKAPCLTFLLRAATGIGAVGTRRDPSGTARAEGAPDLLVRVEYGEVAGGLVGAGAAAALRLINHLEVNEEVLYGRMENIEETTAG